MDGTTYRIASLDDLTKIPVDRLGSCLLDLQYAIELFHFAVGEGASEASMGEMTWTDDENHSVNMRMNGEPLLVLEVTKEKVTP